MHIKSLFPASLLVIVLCCSTSFQWGFYAHQQINRLAVFTLPEELMAFYKTNIEYITENAVNPDKRRYAIADEAAKHYIDLDEYPDSVQADLQNLPWHDAKNKYTEDTLMAYGIVPWQVIRMKHQLTDAFAAKDGRRILRISADMGHYIGDAHVPLHTTANYNGQLSNQIGIHAFWESRLPELFSTQYTFWVGPASYLNKPNRAIWKAILQAHAALDSVLSFEKALSARMPEDKKFTIEERNGLTVRAYSKDFSEKYHRMLGGQVERQMKAAIKLTGDFWYTAWVDAGQPDLRGLEAYKPTEEEQANEAQLKMTWLKRLLNVRREADDD